MLAESPTGFKTIRHPGPRQMRSAARDKTRDSSPSFVKPFSAMETATGKGRAALCSKPMKPPAERHLLLHSSVFFGAASLLKRSTCRAEHSDGFHRAVEGDSARAWAEYIYSRATVRRRPFASIDRNNEKRYRNCIPRLCSTICISQFLDPIEIFDGEQGRRWPSLINSCRVDFHGPEASGLARLNSLPCNVEPDS